MTMLSRVAERLYWMSRYLERAEDTARLTLSYSHLIMDIPEGSDLGWDILVRILDGQPEFASRYRVCNEQNVLKFLIADRDNPSSVPYSIKTARENVRTTRDVLPAEAWEHVNELYLYMDEMADKSVGRRNRYNFLEQIISRCQMINGLLMTTLQKGRASGFIKIGRLLERSDMTTRVIDVGAAAIGSREEPDPALDALLWASLLRALSAISAYRRTVGPLVEADSVVDLLFKDPTLPRSVMFCFNGMREELKSLKNPDPAVQILDLARRRVNRFATVRMPRSKLHDFIDQLQQSLNELNQEIAQTWFLPES